MISQVILLFVAIVPGAQLKYNLESKAIVWSLHLSQYGQEFNTKDLRYRMDLEQEYYFNLDAIVIPVPKRRPDLSQVKKLKELPGELEDVFKLGIGDNILPKKPEQEKSYMASSSSVYVNKDVFTIAEINCEQDSNFLRGWWAKVATLNENTFTAVAREHIAITNNKNLTDSSGEPDSESVHYGEFWCVPKKAWCYKTLKETAFGSTYSVGSEFESSFSNTAVVQAKLLDTFKLIINETCREQ